MAPGHDLINTTFHKVSDLLISSGPNQSGYQIIPRDIILSNCDPIFDSQCIQLLSQYLNTMLRPHPPVVTSTILLMNAIDPMFRKVTNGRICNDIVHCPKAYTRKRLNKVSSLLFCH